MQGHWEHIINTTPCEQVAQRIIGDIKICVRKRLQHVYIICAM